MVSFDKISEKDVICAGGFDLGVVNGLEINTSTWQVTHFHVKLSKQASEDLGFKKRFRSSTVSVPVNMVQAVGDLVTIGKTLDGLSKASEIVEYKE